MSKKILSVCMFVCFNVFFFFFSLFVCFFICLFVDVCVATYTVLQKIITFSEKVTHKCFVVSLRVMRNNDLFYIIYIYPLKHC